MRKHWPLILIAALTLTTAAMTATADMKAEPAEEGKLVAEASGAKAMAGEGLDMDKAKATFESFCSKCHALSRPLGKKKDRGAWTATVNRMSGYHKRFGSEIPEDDRKMIIEYLVNVAGK